MKFKTSFFFFFLTFLLGVTLTGLGAILPHQGRLLISNKAFDGSGFFRFALVDTAGNLVWNHQGATGQPTTDLSIQVKGGFYYVGLGDTSIQGMADLPGSLFSSYPGLKLRIWFNDGTNGLEQLGQDQILLVAPYALSVSSTPQTNQLDTRIASLEASLAQALDRVTSLENRMATGVGSGYQTPGGT